MWVIVAGVLSRFPSVLLTGVGLDPGMVAMQLRTGLLTPAWLLDIARVLGADPTRCTVIAANEMPLRVRSPSSMY